jgi:ubiquinone/menaquinone biosynthesis C-methylase UbiE
MLNEFDGKARNWDNNPVHTERSEAISKALLHMLPLHPGMKAMEFGAGTGLLSFLLKDKLGEIMLLDNSAEMIRMAVEKIERQQIRNMHPLHINLEKEAFSDTFDIIYTQMVFHHIADIGLIINKLHRLIRPGGFLAIADLYPEDGSFHGEGFTGHTGFDPEQYKEFQIFLMTCSR